MTENNSTRKNALVTGGSRGIGASISEKLAGMGYRVFINFTSNEAKAREVAERISSAGGEVILCPFDVSKSDQIDAKVEEITKGYGPISVLVNNAGITRDGLLLRMKDDDISQVLDINLKGAMFCTRAVLKGMIRAKGGSIIHISSVVGQSGNAGQANYVAAKAGLIGFSKAVALEVASRSIRSNVIAPGFIETDMTGALTEDQKTAILRNIPLGIFGQPKDIAEAVGYLASDSSRYLTGQILSVNGGMYL